MTLEFPSIHEKKLPGDIKIVWPTVKLKDTETLYRITGSLVGLAVGDALGASVEFRPQQYLAAYPVTDMVAGGTWGLQAGQWTDDTSMALCLASSLITQKDFNPYDQMVRYKWWYKHGGPDSAGNGALMRLAPVPLFFYRKPAVAVDLSGQSARLTHGDDVAFDACRYYGALIVAAVKGDSKESLISNEFYNCHQKWFGSKPLHDDVVRIARGSFKQPGGYKDGIRGKGHIVLALEAALWAFWSTDTFEKGALNAVNLGDDTDTTAAIYGQLAVVDGPTRLIQM
ncbi:unnamed protein product [Rotaria sordida]|uniref:ADP-ribosylglycohydrolase n=1 Tax=Rotaria sordida TaxID=392033 RepID=A0A819K0B9_9BILA|nr:unnamed protein product [Rotaria sordida]